jgi:GAF domain-containing protein
MTGKQIKRGRQQREPEAGAFDVEAASDLIQACLDARSRPNAVWRVLARTVASCGRADSAVVHLLSHRGRSIRPTAVYHIDPAARGLMLDILELGPHTLVDAFTLRVLQTGRPLRVPILSDDLLRLWVQPEFAAYLEARSVTSILVVPIRIGRRRVGALRAWREAASPAFTDQEQTHVQSLVDSAVAHMQGALRAGNRRVGRVVELVGTDHYLIDT